MTTVSRPVKRKKTNWRRFNWQIFLMAMAGVVFLAIFAYIPMIGIAMAFKNLDYSMNVMKDLMTKPWVGFENFVKFIRDAQFKTVMLNTLSLGVLELVITFPIPIFFALMLNELRSAKFMKFVQTISYLPHFVSTVVLVSMITTILSPSIGSLAKLTKMMGGTPINYLSVPEYFIPINVVSGFWQSVGWEAVIYVSTLAGIDRGLYEAAKIDGANRWQQIVHVSLPGLATTFVLLLIMQVGQLLNVNFEKVYLLQNNLNLSASEMLPTFVYKTGMESQKYGYATAAGLFNSVISVILVFIANTVSRKVSEISLF